MRARVAIGVHAHAESTAFLATLERLRRFSPGAELLLLPDAPDAAIAPALDAQRDLRRLDGARGPAACFNLLAAATADHDFVVLVESGALVTDGWLDRLLRALAPGENG